MHTKRWFHIVILAALIVVTVLTIQAGFATSQLVSAAGSSVCSLPSIRPSTVHATFDTELGMIVARSPGGPTGVDGGLLALLMSYPSCAN